MKTRLAIVTLLIILACAVASAQSYHIRVSKNTNLRASNSLDSVVLASARAGTTLKVVGHLDRWLRISRNGRSYWMAGWVNHARVDAPQPAPPADINNCCFVNGQCSSDQDWIDGYDAYQRAECPAGEPAASATSYHIRVSKNTNLRASNSLDSLVLTSARAGTTVKVVGHDNRWLRISHDGRTYWMAGWVDHTRVDAPQPTPPADVNNCCLVNRQCVSDQDWIDGYDAYQLTECRAEQPAAPVSAPVSAASAPVSAPASQPINNCCFVNRQCASDEEWVDGYQAFQYDNTCQSTAPAAPVSTVSTGHFGCQAPSHSHSVGIFGSTEFKNKLGCALDLLKRKGGRWYDYVVSALKSIQPKGGTLITVYTRSREVYWGTDGGSFVHSDFVSLGAIMVHEACHVHYRGSGSQTSEELECTRQELQALDALGSSPWRRRTLVNRINNLRDDPDLRWWGHD